MPAVASDAEMLRQLDEDTRRAWSAYLEELDGLGGEAYERAEHSSWATLQIELGRLERRRRLLASQWD